MIDAITRLVSFSPQEQQVFKLYYEKYLSEDEIAKTLGISRFTVGALLHRSRLKIKNIGRVLNVHNKN
ncbi:MAG: sigma-70 family RNA polymerase sigma factor [Deltaproteobacteria bacterium]|nr:sigma-70 family RNA polymerase sigma factor [Deltaproteobacteria bacterium]MBW1979135.1 sigma-70 family RNA polymerase sigma factor [Deltaproteobacteria bacterium]MBW2046769.1 sigma-70 family RNA polymerase sigma factor [Deltaproteobacteria bacterium]MBW2301895.1 sigma-70 family RNA polymerase sigma factor [Deltaproteobacteria bacterium]